MFQLIAKEVLNNKRTTNVKTDENGEASEGGEGGGGVEEVDSGDVGDGELKEERDAHIEIDHEDDDRHGRYCDDIVGV